MIFADASISKGFVDPLHRRTDFLMLAKEAQQGNSSAMFLLGGFFALGLVHNRSEHRLAARCYLSAAQLVNAQNITLSRFLVPECAHATFTTDRNPQPRAGTHRSSVQPCCLLRARHRGGGGPSIRAPARRTCHVLPTPVAMHRLRHYTFVGATRRRAAERCAPRRTWRPLPPRELNQQQATI